MCNRKQKIREFTVEASYLQKLLEFYSALLLDNHYWYVSHEDWGKVFKDVLLNMPKYTAEKWDCDDFAFLTKARVAERYKLNAIAIVIGISPMGYHAWNWFYDGQAFYQLEPQTGEVFAIGEGGYIADWILL